MEGLPNTLSLKIFIATLFLAPVLSFAGADYKIFGDERDRMMNDRIDTRNGYKKSYSHSGNQGVPKMGDEWIPFAAESSPRLYNWIDHNGTPHATNEPYGVPKDVVKKLSGRPEGFWIDQQGNLRTLEERIGKTSPQLNRQAIHGQTREP